MSVCFRLYIKVEFLHPKGPIPIFLYNVTADDSIADLSRRVRFIYVHVIFALVVNLMHPN